MTAAHLRPDVDRRPLVAVLCSVPLLGEAMSSTLEFAEVRTFAANAGGFDGLLSWLRPDAVIVDSEAAADSAVTFARDHDLPVVHVCVRTRTLRLFRQGDWEQVSNGEGPTPEAIRDVVAGTLFSRGGALR